MKKKFLITTFLTAIVAYVFALAFELSFTASIIKTVPLISLILLVDLKCLYNKIIFAGFLLSLVGDIFLSQAVDLFIPGLAFFLVAQIFFIFAFYTQTKLPALVSAALSFAYGAGVFFFLKPYTGDMAIPVGVYAFVISAMLWRAAAQYDKQGFAKYAFYGALFFCVSDTLLALNKFYSPMPCLDYGVILTYWVAQFLIYLSTNRKEESNYSSSPSRV